MSSSYCRSGVAVVEQFLDWATATRVRPGERAASDLSGSTAEIAERIMTRHWKADDDALSVVARYLGENR
jgi:hypothetical protein